MASLAASEPAMISASKEMKDDSATEGSTAFLGGRQLMVAEPKWKVCPEVECLTPQSESLKPSSVWSEAV